MLCVSDLNVSYGKVQALRNITMTIPQNSIISLLGANGAGKSTLQKTILGLISPQSGTITFQGKRIDSTSTESIVGQGIVMVPEGRQVFSELTVKENLFLGSYICKDKRIVKERYDFVFDLFPILRERQKQLAGTMSGGQQQMLAIARGLMANPKLLLLDEPSLGLSPIMVQEIFSIIKRINENGVTILLVEQNASMAIRVSHYAYVLEVGEISCEGTSEELQNNDNVRKTYLGG